MYSSIFKLQYYLYVDYKPERNFLFLALVLHTPFDSCQGVSVQVSCMRMVRERDEGTHLQALLAERPDFKRHQTSTTQPRAS
jgi:hypothetical protein